MDLEVHVHEEQQRFQARSSRVLETNVPASVSPSYLELGISAGSSAPRAGSIRRRPPKYGGGGLDVDHAIILEEEADRSPLAAAQTTIAAAASAPPRSSSGGTEEQRPGVLPAIYRGEVRTWPALDEPAGSDWRRAHDDGGARR